METSSETIAIIQARDDGGLEGVMKCPDIVSHLKVETRCSK